MKEIQVTINVGDYVLVRVGDTFLREGPVVELFGNGVMSVGGKRARKRVCSDVFAAGNEADTRKLWRRIDRAYDAMLKDHDRLHDKYMAALRVEEEIRRREYLDKAFAELRAMAEVKP